MFPKPNKNCLICVMNIFIQAQKLRQGATQAMVGITTKKMLRTRNRIRERMKKGEKIKSMEWNDFGDDGDQCGIPWNYCQELASQSVKPWEDDVYNVLGVLFDFSYIDIDGYQETNYGLEDDHYAYFK